MIKLTQKYIDTINCTKKQRILLIDALSWSKLNIKSNKVYIKVSISGNLYELSRIYNGEMFGTLAQWYAGGRLSAKISYKLGKMHGTCEKWYRNGICSGKTQYIDGIMDGIVEHRHKNGRIKFRGFYKNKKPCGDFLAWDNVGKLISRKSYLDGNLHGICMTLSLTFAGTILTNDYWLYGGRVNKEEYREHILIEQLTGI